MRLVINKDDKVTKPDLDSMGKEPQTSKWTISNGDAARLLTLGWYVTLWCLAN